MSPIVSGVSPLCIPLSPIVSQCLQMSPIVSHCLLLCLPLSPVCLPRVSFLNSTVVTQSSISIPFVLRVSLLPTYLDVDGLSEFERMKTTGSDSVQKLIINGWGPGKTGESDKIAPVPGTLFPFTPSPQLAKSGLHFQKFGVASPATTIEIVDDGTFGGKISGLFDRQRWKIVTL